MAPLKPPQIMGFVLRLYMVVRGWNFPELGGSPYLGPGAALECGSCRPPVAGGCEFCPGFWSAPPWFLSQWGLCLCLLISPHATKGPLRSVLSGHASEGETLIGQVKYHCPVRQSLVHLAVEQISERPMGARPTMMDQ